MWMAENKITFCLCKQNLFPMHRTHDRVFFAMFNICQGPIALFDSLHFDYCMLLLVQFSNIHREMIQGEDSAK